MVDVRRAVTVLALVLATAACGSPTPDTAPAPTRSESAAPAVGATGAGARTETIPLGERQFALHVPASYRGGRAVPLVVLLHGYTASADVQEEYFKVTAESDRRGFLYAMPNGTIDQARKRFWNATDACCNFHGSTVDDSGYVSELIATVQRKFTVDKERVYLIGHSNGAFMSYRFACDHADQVTAIAALNGAMWNDVTRCRPSRPVSVLDIRGTADTTILNDGGQNAGRTYPSAATTLADWVRFDGCGNKPVRSANAMDLVTTVRGRETSVTTYSCRAGTRVERWTIEGGPHVPAFTADFAPRVLDFLYAQRSAA